MKKEMTAKDIRERLDKEFEQWDKIMQVGCQDPFWPDGVNLNLVRNHIIHDVVKLADLLGEPLQLSLFDEPPALTGIRDVPPEVPNAYMVRNGTYAEIRIKKLETSWALVFELE